MCIAYIVLASLFCVITEQTTFDESGQGVTDMTVYSIPTSTTVVHFQSNSITRVPSGYFQNLPNLDVIWLWINLVADIDDDAFAGKGRVLPCVSHHRSTRGPGKQCSGFVQLFILFD